MKCRLLDLVVLFVVSTAVTAAELIPPRDQLQSDHPRVLLRPSATPHAVSLEDLRRRALDREADQLLAQLRGLDHAAAQALVWLLTGEESAARKAFRRLEGYTFPGECDTFHTYLRLTELGLAYDWLWSHPEFTPEVKADVRRRVMPLAQKGLKDTRDHMFHNYIWMSAGGVALWALATAGDDAEADRLLEAIRTRFNDGLYPAWTYLDGLPSEPMGYWALYVLTPGVLTLLGAESAYDQDLVRSVRKSPVDWLGRQFQTLLHGTLPNLRYVPWGDLQSGPNGGVTHEMAGPIDAMTWALQSRQGAWFGRQIQKARGSRRFYGETAIYFFLYTRQLDLKPEEPPLSFQAGSGHSGRVIARSSWDPDATIVGFGVTDHFGDHHHYDQGSFLIYRNGLLAVDPPVYPRTRGPQQRTDNHNTLLLGGEGQRPVRGQWFVTVEDFQKNLEVGPELETGNLTFFAERESWVAAAGEFARAYPKERVSLCVRQLLFVRPWTVVVVDQLTGPEGGLLPEVSWLLHVPSDPELKADSVIVSNHGRGESGSWLRLRPVLPDEVTPRVSKSDVGTHRVELPYPGGKRSLVLVHAMDVGDYVPVDEELPSAEVTEQGVEVQVGDTTFLFSSSAPYAVSTR